MIDFNKATDEELMSEYQRGSEQAFTVLYRRHSPRVYGYLKKRTFDADSAGDVLQMVFMKLHQTKRRYDSSYPFLPWLFTVTRTVLIDWQRVRRRHRQELPLENEALEMAVHQAANGSESTDEREWPELSQLTPDQRQAIELRYRNDQSFEEIARVLETSPSNVRQLVSRGIRILKQSLASGGGR